MQWKQRRGSVLVIVLFFAVLLFGFAIIAVDATIGRSRIAVEMVHRLQAETAAISKLNWALAKVRRGGIVTYAENAAYGAGASTNLDVSTAGRQVTILSRGYVGQGAERAVHNVRAVLVTFRFIPNGPLYFGNGAVEWPRGNMEGHSVDSFISNAMDYTISAWNHPYDHIYDDTPMTRPPDGDARWVNQDPDSPFFGQPYSVFENQNWKGKQNITDWLTPWTYYGTTYNPMDQTYVEHPTDAGYEPFPTHTLAPDVQTFAYDLWAHPPANSLYLSNGDVRYGRYGNLGSDEDGDGIDDGLEDNGLGTLDNPRVVFVTGEFLNSNKAFKGSGILVVRDDYDPAVGGNRLVSNKAKLRFAKDFEWTGLVMVAGWAPHVSTKDLPADQYVKINGAIMGEDSVQSGGESSLDNATIQFYLGYRINSSTERGHFTLTYSRDVFSEFRGSGTTNPMWALMPEVDKRLTEMITSGGNVVSWTLPAGWPSL